MTRRMTLAFLALYLSMPINARRSGEPAPQPASGLRERAMTVR